MSESIQNQPEVKFYKNLTEQLRENPKIITKTELVSVANSMMENTVKSDFKYGFIIVGDCGVGKTAAIEYFAQANDLKGVNTQIIQIESSIVNSLSDNSAKPKIEQFLNQYKDNKVCFYIKVSSKNFKSLAEFICNWEENNNRKTTCKFFIELASNFDFWYNEIPSLFELYFNVYFADWRLYSLAETLQVYSPRIEEFSKKYEISYNLKDLECLVVGIENSLTNFWCFEFLIKDAFKICKDNGEKVFKQSVWKKMFPDFVANLNRRTKKQIERTAYHEAGHSLFVLLNPEYFQLTGVDIIPKNNCNGITRSWDYPSINSLELLNARIMKCLAGRLVESIILDIKVNSGARNDLENANSYVSSFVDKLGALDELGENFIFLNKECEKGIFSNEVMRIRENEKIRLLKNAKEQATKIILEHREFIELLAQKLIKKKYVTETEVNRMWKKYIKEKKKK